LPENSASLDSNTACFEKPSSNSFTFLMALWLVVLVLPALASGSRADAYSTKSGSLAESNASTSDIPLATVEALTGWLHKKEYRYVIMSVPGMEATTGPPEKNYADFRNHMLACPGVCIGAFDFEWTVPRGHGTVPTDEPAMFSWAPDTPPAGLKMMAFMKLKMQMPMKIDEVKKSLHNWNGAFIQCNDEANLHPDWVVPYLRGGRMGNRKDKLNAEGKALWDKLAGELEIGSSGDFEPIHVASDENAAKWHPPAEGDKPKPAAPKPSSSSSSTKPATGGNPGSGIPATSKEAIEGMIAQMVDETMSSRRSEISEAAKAEAEQASNEQDDTMITEVAKKAAKDAVQSIFRTITV